MDGVHQAVYTYTMRRTNIYLSDTQLEELRLIGDRSGAPMAETVRRAVDDFIVRDKLIQKRLQDVIQGIERELDAKGL